MNLPQLLTEAARAQRLQENPPVRSGWVSAARPACSSLRYTQCGASALAERHPRKVQVNLEETSILLGD